MFLRCGVENPYRLFFAHTVRNEILDKQIITFYEVHDEIAKTPIFKEVSKIGTAQLKKVLSWVDVPSLRTVLIYGEFEPIIGIHNTEEQRQEYRWCTTITYQEEEQPAIVGKFLLPEPEVSNYNNSQFITIKSKTDSSSFIYTIGGV